MVDEIFKKRMERLVKEGQYGILRKPLTIKDAKEDNNKPPIDLEIIKKMAEELHIGKKVK